MPEEGDMSPANLSVGQKVEAKIIDVNLDDHRIGLTLDLNKKQGSENKEEKKEEEKTTDEQKEEAPAEEVSEEKPEEETVDSEE
jgi:ribosomal protein S1